MEIENWEEGRHCFGEYLRVNGEDFEDLNQEKVLEFAVGKLKNSRNKTYMLQKTLQMVLEDMDFGILVQHIENKNYVKKCLRNAKKREMVQ